MKILDYIEKVKQENEGPRTMAQEPRNMYAGGQLVTPSVDGSRPGYAGRRYSTEKNFGQRGAKVITIDGKDYRLNTRGPNTGKVSFKTTKDGKDITEYLTPKQLKKRLKKKISSTIIKPGQATKLADKINNNINSWTQKWVKNNTDKYGVRNFDNFQNDMAKAWKKELAANPNKYKGTYGVGMRITNELGLPVVKKGIAINGINFPLRPDLPGFKPELAWQKVFYKNKLNDKNFKAKVNQYLDWATANKKLNPQLLDPNNPIGEGSRSKTLALKYGKKFRGFDDDVVYFMGEVLNNRALNPGGVQTGINDIFKKEFGKNADAYFKKYQGSWARWTNNFFDVAKLAGLNETQAKALLQKQINNTQKIMKGFNVKKLPLEFMIAQDHIMGLAEAKASGDRKIAWQTLNNLIASTREQNRVLGQEGFSNRRVKLIKDFKAAPKNARIPIIEKLNALAEEFVPGRLRYDVRKDGSLKITNLQPETSIKAKTKAYEKITKTFPKNIQKVLSTPEGRLLNRQTGTAKVLNKILEKNKIKICNDKLSDGKGVVCGAKFAERNPNAFMEAIKKNKDAVKIINKPGLIKNALKGVSAWAKKELGPMGWIGSIATIDAAFGLHAVGQGKTPLQALDTTLWFLPKSVLKADEKMFKDVYERAGYTKEDFGEFQKWRELEDLDRQYFNAKKQTDFMQKQVLMPDDKTVLEKGLQKEVDALPDMYKDMGWNRPLFAITSKEEKTKEHPFYGPAVDRYNKIIDRSEKVYKSLEDPDKSWEDLDYTRKLVAMEQANRKKKLMRESLRYAPHLIPLFEPFSKFAPKEMKDQSFLYDEYVHPLYGPSVSPEQMAAVDEGRFRADLYSDGGRAGYMGGGIAGIRRPHAIPPERGGLRSIMINVNDA